MGVPKFYRWLSERYPLINQQCNSAIRPEFDCLYLDMNGILHNASFSDDDHLRIKITEEQIFSNVFKYVDKLFQLARPKKLLFMAIDGVAPRAKMNQQRQRRFRSAQDREKQVAEARERGEISQGDLPFDSNQITPGTEFMKKVSDNLKFFIRKKIKEDSAWKNIEVILSGAEVPGEGEHKIMLYIRNMKMQMGYDPNLRHCLYGLDADLIFLSLVSHEPHFALLREEVVFGSGRQGTLPRKQLKKLDEFQFLHISVLRDYIELEFSLYRSHFTWGWNLERIIDDWVLLSFLVGNDFLAHLPTLDIGEGGLDTLISLYKASLPQLGGYLIDSGKVNADRLEVVLRKMGEYEETVFQERLDRAAADEKKERRRNRRNNEIAVNERFDGEGIDEKNKETFGTHDEDEKKPLPQVLQRRNDDVSDKDKDGSDEADAEVIFPSPSPQPSPYSGNSSPFLPPDVPIEELTGAAMKARYYHDKFPEFYNMSEMQRRSPELIVPGCPNTPEGWIRGLVTNYLEGLHWILAYYYNGVPSWKWYFKFRYAPLASDMKDLASLNVGFSLGLPFRPLEQLLGTLPPASRGFLPVPYRELMTSESPIVDFYPTDFAVDMNGKRSAWEGIALIPFIDETRLLGAVNKIDKVRLSQLERLRNVRFGDEYIYKYDEKVKDTFPSLLNQFGPVVECNSKCSVWKLPSIPTQNDSTLLEEKISEAPRFSSMTSTFIDLATRHLDDDKEDKDGFSAFAALSAGSFKPELCKGVTLPLPGFPNLNAINVKGRLDAIGVNVFGMDSKKESLLLQIESPPSPPSVDAIAAAYVGKRAYFDWPFLRECIVTSISDSMCLYTVSGKESLSSSQSDNFNRDAQHLKVKYLSSKAVDCGSVHYIARVRPFESMKRMHDGSIQKYFAENSTMEIPYQVIVPSSEAAEKDSRFFEVPPPTLQSTFPVGMNIVYIGPKYYGTMATITGHTSTQPGKQRVSLELVAPPAEPDFGHAIANSSRLQFYPSYMVAKAIDILPSTLGKLTSSVFVSNNREVDLGLKIRYSKQGMAVPEYARRVDSWKGGSAAAAASSKSGDYNASQDIAGSWEYSEKTIALLLAYKKRFPKFFEAINSNTSTFKFNPTDFVTLSEKEKDNEPTKAQGDAAVSEIVEWLKTVGISNLILVPCTSNVMADRGVKAIEVESARVRSALQKKPPQIVKMDSVPIAHLYAPSPPVPWSPTEGESPDLGDRVVTIRSDTGVLLGLRGTVVAVHGNFCEVVFDEEFMSGNTLNNRCSNLRGQTVPFSSLLNITKPKVLVLTATKKNKLESAEEVKSATSNTQPISEPKKVKEESKELKEPEQSTSLQTAKVSPAPIPTSEDIASQLKSMLGVGAPSALGSVTSPTVPSIGVQPGADDSDIDPMARKLAQKKAKKAMVSTVLSHGSSPMFGVPPQPFPPGVFVDPMGMPFPIPLGAPPMPGMPPPGQFMPPTADMYMPPPGTAPMFFNGPSPVFYPPPPNAGFIPPPQFMQLQPQFHPTVPSSAAAETAFNFVGSTDVSSKGLNNAPTKTKLSRGGANARPTGAHSAATSMSSPQSAADAVAMASPSKPKPEWKPKDHKEKSPKEQ